MGDPVEIDNDQNWPDQRSTYDALRSRCAVAHEDGRWLILRHAEAVATATDPGTFSSRVTARRAIVDALPRGVTVRTIASIGIPFAVRSQSSWLHWPSDLEDELVEWIRDNHAATRSGDRDRTTQVADRFDRMIHGLLDARRDAQPTDVTGQLMNDTVNGRPLTDEESTSRRVARCS